MKTELNYYGCDLGASSTRTALLKNGNIHILPNNIQVIPLESNTAIIETQGIIENKLDFTINKVEGLVESSTQGLVSIGNLKDIVGNFPMRVLVGDIANRFGLGKSANEYPNGFNIKMKQRVNWVNLLTNLAYNVVKDCDELEANTDLGDVKVVLALPPAEVKTFRDSIIEQLKGTYEITLNLFNGSKVKFNIVDVTLVYESSMAVLSYLMGLENRQIEGTLLSLDIGSSTTDVILVENSRPNESSGATIKKGCSLIKDTARDLFANLGISISGEVLDKAIYEGRYKVGADYQDCSDIIVSAKKESAKRIVQDLLSYCNRNDLNLSLVTSLLVTGGGSLSGKYLDAKGKEVETSKSMAHYILEELKGEFKLGLPSLAEYNGDSRQANIIGVSHKLKALERKDKATK